MPGLFGLPFPSPLSLPLPRRFVVLGASAILVFLIFQSFSAQPSSVSDGSGSYYSPSNWIPPIFGPKEGPPPPEFDEDGRCLFLSPFDALSPAEKARAAFIELVEVSPGVVQARSIETGELIKETEEGEHEPLVGTPPTGLTHPILALLRDGESKWNNLLNRQSRTLEEAVDTYVGRWGRQPPKGFDAWWQFARSRDVLLVDEYDA